MKKQTKPKCGWESQDQDPVLVMSSQHKTKRGGTGQKTGSDKMMWAYL